MPPRINEISRSSSFFKYSPDERFNGWDVLNIGCGECKFTSLNVINLDKYAICNPDIAHDLEKPLPFQDNTFDYILANHVFEHIKDWWQCFNECARILRPGGMLEIWVPGMGNDSVWGYRDHVSVISSEGFYGTYQITRTGGNAWAEEQKTHDEPARKMEIMDRAKRFHRYWWLRHLPDKMKLWCGMHLRNCVEEERYLFKKRSDNV